MRNLIAFILLTASLCAYSKTTYIPKYSSYIEIANDTDTLFFEGNKTSLYADDNNTMFRIGIVHETLSVRKIKYIRHNEINASLYAVSAIVSGVSSLSSNNSQRFHGRSQMYLSKTLSDIYSQNASAAKRLGINIYIENTSKEEIMVADIERGLIWYLQPGAFYSIPLPNPDMMQFRISDLNHQRISRVTMGAGSLLRKAEVEWENDEYWVFPKYETDAEGTTIINDYFLVDKSSGEQNIISKEELKRIKNR